MFSVLAIVFVLNILFSRDVLACCDGGLGPFCPAGETCEVTGCSGGICCGSCVSSCFLPGTKIDTKDGIKNIEDVKVGDWVKSYDPPHATLEDKDGNITLVYAGSQYDQNHKVDNGDGTWTKYVYDQKRFDEIKADWEKSHLNIFVKLKNKIVEKWERLMEYFTPLERI